MLLKRGITGFFNVDAGSLEENDYTAFQQICYSIIHINNWHLINVCNPDHTNYFYAQFISNKQNLYVLLNKYYPIAAFTNELTMNEKTFIDVPENLYMNYDIVGAEILNSPFTDSQHNLSKAELEQIRYWNPISVGNIIFNEWD